MKKIIEKMEELKLLCEEQILDRTDVFDNRSERWQESEKGELYSERTEKFQEMYDELEDWIAELGEDL